MVSSHQEAAFEDAREKICSLFWQQGVCVRDELVIDWCLCLSCSSPLHRLAVFTWLGEAINTEQHTINCHWLYVIKLITYVTLCWHVVCTCMSISMMHFLLDEVCAQLQFQLNSHISKLLHHNWRMLLSGLTDLQRLSDKLTPHPRKPSAVHNSSLM